VQTKQKKWPWVLEPWFDDNMVLSPVMKISLVIWNALGKYSDASMEISREDHTIESLED
jgi:hypothetical protein